ncbi:MAG: hypothetical protein JWR85_2393 [Marmoricola sp.]|nr:hypothetical protein [Marmoricola sp.]MDB5556996.1 hypothetical protein [Rhizobium sp.]
MARVTVQVEWPDGLQSLPENAQARITVEDATLADESSVVLGESVVDDLDVDHPPLVEVDIGEVDPSANLIVRVQVADSQRKERGVAVGDLISTQSHPVLTRGHGDSVVVPVRSIGP